MSVDNIVLIRGWKVRTTVECIMNGNLLIRFSYNKILNNLKDLKKTMKYLKRKYKFNFVTVKVENESEDTDKLVNEIKKAGITVAYY